MKLVTWNIQWCLRLRRPRRPAADRRRRARVRRLRRPLPAGGRGQFRHAEGQPRRRPVRPHRRGAAGLHRGLRDRRRHRRARRRAGARFGNMILSRLPVRWAQRRLLPWPADASVRNMPRVLVEVLVDAPFGPLRVLTTHLEYYSPLQRAAQLEAVRDRHAEACAHALAGGVGSESDGAFDRQPQTVSAILTGDFNFRPGDPLHERLGAAFGDVRVAAARGRVAAPASRRRAGADGGRPRLPPVAGPVRLRLHLRDQRPARAPAPHRRRRRHRCERPSADAGRARLAGASSAGTRHVPRRRSGSTWPAPRRGRPRRARRRRRRARRAGARRHRTRCQERHEHPSDPVHARGPAGDRLRHLRRLRSRARLARIRAAARRPRRAPRCRRQGARQLADVRPRRRDHGRAARRQRPAQRRLRRDQGLDARQGRRRPPDGNVDAPAAASTAST